MTSSDSRPHERTDKAMAGGTRLPVVVATIFREHGSTGVHTHFEQLRQYLEPRSGRVTIVTPFSWRRWLTYPVFGPRLLLQRWSGAASVFWYRHWHEVFLTKALHACLADIGECVVYAQGPVEARAALRTRRDQHQRVVLAVHFRTSQADEHAEPGREIAADSTMFRRIRKLERDVIPRVDGLVYVSEWARTALLGWLPEAAHVPHAVISNFVAPMPFQAASESIGDLVTTGKLEDRKNHRFLLEVLAEAKAAGREYTLDVFGDGPLRHDLARYARDLGLHGQVRFRGYRPDVRRYLPCYRAYAHAAYAETSSLAIIEAMAVGLPVVAAPIGPIPELCTDGVEARFWPLDDAAEAAMILMNLLDSEPTRLMLAKAARERFHREFDARLLGPRLVSFLTEPSTRRPRPADDAGDGPPAFAPRAAGHRARL
ncbi:MAG TPA: glycosyltransferase [Streptosporangiaceae bacterium]|nr:glycosyltransferase [Streptosporangiaceae bacterium]